MNYRELLKDKKRVVIKVGSSSLIHKETNKLDLRKLEVLVRELVIFITRAKMLSWLLQVQWQLVHLHLACMRSRQNLRKNRHAPQLDRRV